LSSSLLSPQVRNDPATARFAALQAAGAKLRLERLAPPAPSAALSGPAHPGASLHNHHPLSLHNLHGATRSVSKLSHTSQTGSHLYSLGGFSSRPTSDNGGYASDSNATDPGPNPPPAPTRDSGSQLLVPHRKRTSSGRPSVR
jgi:hypothetical protein